MKAGGGGGGGERTERRCPSHLLLHGIKCLVVVCSIDANPISSLQTKAAYVLFYQRRDPDAPAKPQPSASLGGAHELVDDHMDTN